MKHLLSTAILGGLILGLGGCSSATYKKGEATASGIQKSADLVGSLQKQIDLVLTNLNDLVEKPKADLRPQFKDFSSSVTKLESLAKNVASAAKSMSTKGQAYFTQWDQEVAKIQNEDIRTRSQTRKDEVAKQFDVIKLDYEEARKAYEPFGSDLRDVQQFLATDLTKGGLAAIKEPVAKAIKNAGPLKESLGKLVADFRALGVSMSASMPAPQ